MTETVDLSKFEVYSWNEFDDDCRKIAAWAKDKGIRGVYGMPRGGLFVAVRLSHLLDIPLILSRDDIRRDTLIVDDIVDNGNTLRAILASAGGERHTASLYIAEHANPKPEFFARIKSKFVKFPWEEFNTAKYDGTLG